MAAYDLEEQEKIDDLKAWWQQYGSTITVGIVLACIVIGSVQGWRWWAGRRSADASVLYQAVSDGVRKSDPAKVKDAMAQLTDKFAGTAYAPRAALLYAKPATSGTAAQAPAVPPAPAPATVAKP